MKPMISGIMASGKTGISQVSYMYKGDVTSCIVILICIVQFHCSEMHSIVCILKCNILPFEIVICPRSFTLYLLYAFYFEPTGPFFFLLLV